MTVATQLTSLNEASERDPYNNNSYGTLVDAPYKPINLPIRRLNLPLQDRFRARKINLEIARTGSAVSTYNILLGEGRRVAAGLIAVE